MLSAVGLNCSETSAVRRGPKVPRYYFNFRDGDHLAEDHTGAELAGVKDAHRQAQHMLGGILSRVSGSASHRVLVIEVRDEAGRSLFRAKLSFEIEPPTSSSSP